MSSVCSIFKLSGADHGSIASVRATRRNAPQRKISMTKANPAMLCSVERDRRDLRRERAKLKTVQIVPVRQENRN